MNEWRTRIVIVGQEEAARSFMGEMLRREGFHVELAADAAEALAACYRFRPQVVLLDATLPEEGSFRLARMIKSAAELRPTGVSAAIVLLTQTRLDPDRELSLNQFYGADAVLYTPFEKDALVRTVRGLLATERARDIEAELLQEEEELPDLR